MTAKTPPEQLPKKTIKERSMTASEFAAVEQLLDISPDRIKAARLVLVDGMTYEGAAKVVGLGWTRQAVTSCINVVLRKFKAYQAALAAAQANKEIPDGWEQITLVAPRDLIPAFHAQIKATAASDQAPNKPEEKEQ